MRTLFLAAPRMLGLLALLASLSALPVTAQTNTIDWYTISSGGGLSTGGVYSLTAVIGQPATEQLSGGNYRLQGGFLSAVGLVQTTGMPRLALALTNGFARVSWVRTDSVTLEKTTSLSGTPIPWGSISGAYQTNSTEVFVLEPLLPGNQFFRLKR